MLGKIRHLNIVVIFMLLLQLAVYPASVLGNEKSRITVEQAVQVVKDNFSIPEKYSRLSTGYNEYNKVATYFLSWNAVGQPGGSFHAEVDATTGEIVSMNQWDQRFKPSFKLPVLSADEAEKIATELILKLSSKPQSEMKLVSDEQQVYSLNNAQPFTYNFRWIRMVNGIPFPGNGVNVSISGDDGQVRSYNYNWTRDLVFPAASDVISLETARQVFADTPMLELQYFVPPILHPQTSSEPQSALLVYQLNNQYYEGAIDALSGKPVTLDTQAGNYTSMNTIGEVSEVSKVVSVPITAETTSIDIKKLPENSEPPESGESPQISQEEAVEIVKKMIEIPKNLVLQHSGLNPDWQNPSETIWDLHWNSESFRSGDQRHLNACVNAKTGDIINFNQFIGINPDDKSEPITRKDAQRLAEDFLKRIQPERFKLVKVQSENVYGQMSPNLQSFYYVRIANGLPVSRNGMNITVDTLAKQVSNYDLNWSNQKFPKPSDVLSLNDATERLLKMRPLALNYMLIYQQNEKHEVRLVYQPNSDFSMYVSGMIDAKTGDPMDWYGKSQSQWFRSQNFTDIQGNYAEKEINIMGLTGAFGEYGDTFRPDEKITAGSLLRAMITAEGNNQGRVLNDKDVLMLAKERGWVYEDLKLGSELRRDDLSKMMIRLINMDTSAKVKGIYAVPFTDANTIEPDSLGYIALAWGLGILKLDENTLYLNQTVTRAEAAYALVHAYAVEQPQNPYMR